MISQLCQPELKALSRLILNHREDKEYTIGASEEVLSHRSEFVLSRSIPKFDIHIPTSHLPRLMLIVKTNGGGNILLEAPLNNPHYQRSFTYCRISHKAGLDFPIHNINCNYETKL